MGRTASGVKGINLGQSKCIAVDVVKDTDNILLVTEKGYGKQTNVCEYRKTKRGSKGVKALSITEKNGNITTIKTVIPNTDLMLITNSGIIMRMSLDQVSTLGRVTQGTRLINLKDDSKLSTVSLVPTEDTTSEIENNVSRETLE